MKIFICLVLILFHTSVFAASSIAPGLRTFSKIIKISKVVPNPLWIMASIALGVFIDQMADSIEEADEVNVDSDTDTIVQARANLDTGLNISSKSKENALTEEAQEDDKHELPTVVIVHGFISSDKFHDSKISPLTKELIKRGFPVYIAKISKIKFAVQQAELLNQEIEHFVGKDKELILIGHSLGGIISRKYASEHWKNRNIRNVISIGTPHWGVDQKSRISFIALNKILNTYANLGSRTAAKILETVDYLDEDYMVNTFNQEITNIPGIDYLSVMTIDSSLSNKTTPIQSRTYKDIIDPFDNNISDGLVPVRTSMWSKMLYANKCVYDVDYSREIRGPLYEANHLTQISTLNAALSLKNNAYRLARDLVHYITESLNGGYTNPPHCHIY